MRKSFDDFRHTFANTTNSQPNVMNNIKNTVVLLHLFVLLGGACCIKTQQQASPFVHVEKGMFIRDSKLYKYRGADFGDGAFLLPKVKGKLPFQV